MSGAPRGLEAARVQFQSTVPVPHPNTVCSSRASALLRDCKTLLCTGFFILPHGISMDSGYVFLESWDVQRTTDGVICSPEKYVNVPYATCWPKMGSCNLGSELNCYAEQGVVL